MKFYPPDNQPMQIGLTTGHVAIVEPGGTELDARFHREAIAKGCMPEGIERDKPVEAKGFDKMSAIINTVIEMVDEGNEAEFTGDGKPDVRALSKRVGFTVSREERDTAWEAVADDSPAAE